MKTKSALPNTEDDVGNYNDANADADACTDADNEVSAGNDNDNKTDTYQCRRRGDDAPRADIIDNNDVTKYEAETAPITIRSRYSSMILCLGQLVR